MKYIIPEAKTVNICHVHGIINFVLTPLWQILYSPRDPLANYCIECLDLYSLCGTFPSACGKMNSLDGYFSFSGTKNYKFEFWNFYLFLRLKNFFFFWFNVSSALYLFLYCKDMIHDIYIIGHYNPSVRIIDLVSHAWQKNYFANA